MRWTSKIVHEWNVHLEICIRPQAKENSRQYLLFRTDILQKTVVGSPWFHNLIGDGLNMLLDISAYQQRIVTIKKLKIERSERLISSRLVQDKTELTILKWQLNASRNTWCNTVAGYIIVYVFSIFWLNFQTELYVFSSIVITLCRFIVLKCSVQERFVFMRFRQRDR